MFMLLWSWWITAFKFWHFVDVYDNFKQVYILNYIVLHFWHIWQKKILADRKRYKERILEKRRNEGF